MKGILGTMEPSWVLNSSETFSSKTCLLFDNHLIDYETVGGVHCSSRLLHVVLAAPRQLDNFRVSCDGVLLVKNIYNDQATSRDLFHNCILKKLWQVSVNEAYNNGNAYLRKKRKRKNIQRQVAERYITGTGCVVAWLNVSSHHFAT